MRKHSNPLDPYYTGNIQNTPPTAVFEVTPDTGLVNQSFSFDASMSTDAEDTTVSLNYRWDWNNDDNYDEDFDTSSTINHTFTTAGLKTIRLQVRDSGGLTDTTTQTVLVQSGAQGQIRGSIFHALSDNPIADVRVKALNASNVEVESTLSNSNGTYELSLGTDQFYTLVYTKDGFLDVVYEQISVFESQVLFLEAISQIPIANSGSGSVTGELKNATNGEGIAGVSIDLREGLNVRSGSIIASTTTDVNGLYQIDVDAGNYTAEASHPGFNTTYFTITSIGGHTQVNENTSLSPTLTEGQMRFVLTWGENPYDLDSHLTGPIPDSTGRFHIYYNAKGDTNSIPFAVLDHDDTQQHGPETITIAEIFDGVYRYSVHDFSNRDLESSIGLSNSGAKVEIYEGNSLIQSFNVPNNTGGTLWTVFEMENGVITSINEMTYVKEPIDIQKRINGSPVIDPVFEDFNFPDK